MKSEETLNDLLLKSGNYVYRKLISGDFKIGRIEWGSREITCDVTIEDFKFRLDLSISKSKKSVGVEIYDFGLSWLQFKHLSKNQEFDSHEILRQIEIKQNEEIANELDGEIDELKSKIQNLENKKQEILSKNYIKNEVQN